MAILEVENLRKSFGALEVLKDISFSLNKGEALSIIGSSGSGKTTLLRCLNFLETPDKGSIVVQGKTLFDAEPEGITAAQLGEICGKDKADVSRMVAILENKGLVRKVAVGKNMYRAKLVLTETGREAAEHVRSRAAVAVELAGSGLSEDEREQFYKALTLITENLRKLSKDGLPQK